jgi:hypothetical protein
LPSTASCRCDRFVAGNRERLTRMAGSKLKTVLKSQVC